MLSGRQCWKALLVAAMFAWGLAAVTILMPVAARLAGQRGMRCNDAVRRHWCRTVCRILGVRIDLHGGPADDARLTVANHVSWLDIIVLGSLQSVTFVAKSEVSDWPVMGYLARRIGTLFITRGDVEQTAAIAEQMVWQLRQGKRLMLFPEGTTTRGDRVLRFHGKLLQPAQLAHVAVQAVALRYRGDAASVAPFIGEDAFVPHLLEVLRLSEIPINVRYCTPLPAGLHRDALARTARNQVVEALSDQGEALPQRVRKAVI